MDSVSHETENFFIQKEKRRKWIFGRLKSKRLPSIKAPLPSKGTTLSEAEQEQSKHALTVAIASAAVAEAAVTAAHRLTGQRKKNSKEYQHVKTRNDAPQSTYQCQREIKESTAAIQDEQFSALSLETMKGISPYN